MKIRMLTGISGPTINVAPKEETEAFSDAEAFRLMLSGQAEPADEEAAAEAEAIAGAMTAVAAAAIEAGAAPAPAAVVAPVATVSLERPARASRKAKKA